MLFHFLFIVVFICCAWVYMRWQKVKRFWAEKGVPHHPPNPLYGSLTFLMRENTAVFMKNIYNEFKVPYVGIWAFWRPALIINDPELARRILVKDSDIFRNRSVSSGKMDPVGALNIFTVNDPLWSTVRKRLTPAFTSAKLRANQNIISTKAANLIQRIRQDTKMGKVIDLRSVFADYTTDVIGESAFGVTCDATTTGASPIREVTKEYMRYNTVRGLSWISIFFLPEAVDLFGFSLFPKKTNVYLRKVLRMIVEQRGGYEKDIKESRDILDMLIKMKQDAAKENEDITEDILLAQAAIMLQGGFDTTAVTLTYTMYHLAFAVEIQDKLYREILETKENNNNDNLDSSLLAKMPYLNAILKESLRLYPVMGWLDRVALTDYKIDDKLTIPAGTPVYVNAVGMQVDPAYYPEPETFNPDRFLPENETGVTPYTYMPFGDGPRSCIGRRFAQQNFQWALVSLVSNFEFRPYPDSPKPSDVGLEKKGLLLMPAEMLSVEIIPRK